jgi:hypothetical protein
MQAAPASGVAQAKSQIRCLRGDDRQSLETPQTNKYRARFHSTCWIVIQPLAKLRLKPSEAPLRQAGFYQKEFARMFRIRIDPGGRVWMLPQDVIDESVHRL